MIAFAYFGGKQQLLKQLLPILPATSSYCEPFAGSAAVLINRDASPIEVLNDLNGDIVNFFKVLRQDPEKLVYALNMTPYSLQEFNDAWENTECPVENARRFYVRVQMDIAKAGARKDRSWSTNRTYVNGNHSYCVKNFFKKQPGLLAVADRLRNCQIDNRPALKCIEKFDSKDTLFYCDPPYMPKTRSSANDYKFELNEEGHYTLSALLNKVKGKVALSGYDHPLMNEWYPAGQWHKTLFKSRRPSMSKGSGLVRQECLWTNYIPGHAVQGRFFEK